MRLQRTTARRPPLLTAVPLLAFLAAACAATGPAADPAPRPAVAAALAAFGAPPEPAPAAWRGLIGDYVLAQRTLAVQERDGRLWVIVPDEGEYELVEASALHPPAVHFRARGPGRSPDLPVVFFLSGGAAAQLRLGTELFERIYYGGEDGATFRIEPLRPVDELRRAAHAASPPAGLGGDRAPDLVDLATLDPTLRFDIRYAGSNNFMGAPFYSEARAFLQRPAAHALLRAHHALAAHGYGLLVFDAYRPWFVTRMFWDATPDSLRHFVADPTRGSRHNRGAAVDLTLYDLATGRPIEMVGGYDEFSPRSHPEYPGGTSRQRWHRALLRAAMEAEGFQVYEHEWWHFDFADWQRYPVLNLTFDRIP
jgi:D-alanyl-D-alanine dipeptidase